ncbi:hypothetical protein TRAPUB_1715 [Trametes pubescens]|uniref:Uncharacterized protein n=1 Tax=Trametes pubescens TaxID=154538 RepID=A0A1M2VIJ0_TRAPU|nr:hypothetical protein TRAPUB_1715 [Trametes pubescens]
MRVSTLSAVCATALILPISAAPLDITTVLHVSPLPTVTVEVNGPTEIPNPPMAALPTMSPKAEGAGKLSKSFSKNNKLSRLPRADFRQADYGVSHNVTFIKVPVQGVEATPSSDAPAALTRRSEDDWEANRLHSDHASSNAAAPSGDLAGAAPDTSDASESGLASAAPPLAFGDFSKTNTNNVPVHPNMASVSNAAGGGIQTLGESRYKTSYATHDALSQLHSSAGGFSMGGLLRRVLQRARDFEAHTLDPNSNPIVKRFYQLAKDFGAEAKDLGAHTMQLNTNAVMPERQDSSLNMSDPYVAQEEMRRQHAGVLNIDSNRPAPPPPAADGPLNATDTGAALKEQAGGAKNSTTLPIAEHEKSSKSAVENAKKKAMKV